VLWQGREFFKPISRSIASNTTTPTPIHLWTAEHPFGHERPSVLFTTAGSRSRHGPGRARQSVRQSFTSSSKPPARSATKIESAAGGTFGRQGCRLFPPSPENQVGQLELSGTNIRLKYRTHGEAQRLPKPRRSSVCGRRQFTLSAGKNRRRLATLRIYARQPVARYCSSSHNLT